MPKIAKPAIAAPPPSNGVPVPRIAPALASLAVPMASLRPDPDNARRHPERNMEAIVESLRRYGQLKPVVVRESDRTILAGNGTFEAARRLGWRTIAANLVGHLPDAAMTGFGLADNRSAELAEWDYATVARLEAMIRETDAGGLVGWTDDELEVLRVADWTPPTITGEEFTSRARSGILEFTPEQMELILDAAGGMDPVEFLVALCMEAGK